MQSSRLVLFLLSVHALWNLYSMPRVTGSSWRSGESTGPPPMWPWFDSRIGRHNMWVEFVGSLLCSERFFPGYSGFPLSPITNI